MISSINYAPGVRAASVCEPSLRARGSSGRALYEVVT